MLSSRLFHLFMETATQEVGLDKLPAILSGNQLSPALLEPGSLARLDADQACRANASIQQALRLYYGRGARGILLRIGQGMWSRMTSQASLLEKAELEIARRLPVPARRRRILEVLAARLCARLAGRASVHSLDLDLLLVDHCGLATLGQSSPEPICFVTLGLIQGASFLGHRSGMRMWKKSACQAAGAPACEFKGQTRRVQIDMGKYWNFGMDWKSSDDLDLYARGVGAEWSAQSFHYACPWTWRAHTAV